MVQSLSWSLTAEAASRRSHRCRSRLFKSVATLLVCLHATWFLHETASSLAVPRSLQPDLIVNQALDSPTSSPNKKARILLGIFTTDDPKETQRRQVQRETWISYYQNQNDSENPNKICSLTELQQRKVKAEDCQLAYVYVIGADPNGPTDVMDLPPKRSLTINRPSHLQHLEENFIFLRIRENMNDGKTPSWFQYASNALSHEFGFDYIAKSDTDTLLHPPNFFRAFHSKCSDLDRNALVYGGISYIFNEHNKAFSKSLSLQFNENNNPIKKTLSVEDYRKVQAKLNTNAFGYQQGQFFLLSRSLAETVTSPNQVDRKALHIPLEDAWMGAMVTYLASTHQVLWVHFVVGENSWKHGGQMKDPKMMRVAWKDYNANLEAHRVFDEMEMKLRDPQYDKEKLVMRALGALSARARMKFLHLVDG